jgi:23S rRNA (adenine2030-N6)-methyltransferase
MFVMNPPWTLADSLKETLPFLEKAMRQDDRSAWKLDYLAD